MKRDYNKRKENVKEGHENYEKYFKVERLKGFKE